MAEQIEITTTGIKKVLSRYTPESSIAEYIWNGFDAGADTVEILFLLNEMNVVTELKVKDNGHGIPHSELKQKFKPFFESKKIIEISSPKNHSLSHGKNGVGRLTFFTFAHSAHWTTNFKIDESVFTYNIDIVGNSLDQFNGINSDVLETDVHNTGTEVRFSGLQFLTKEYFDTKIVEYLKLEFGWFLELYKNKNFNLLINGERLNYETIIGDRDTTLFVYQPSGVKFDVSYIRWNERLPQEYSKYYYCNLDGDEKWKDHTTLNNKGDNFYHSVYIVSDYFESFLFETKKNEQQLSFQGTVKDEEWKFLHDQLSNYLRLKRKPFLSQYADRLIAEYERESIFPNFSEYDQYRNEDLKAIVKGLYEVQPKIFSGLNYEQKRTFVGFLNLLLDSEEREGIFKILEEFIALDMQERNELLSLLQVTKLNRVVRTISLIKDRYKTVASLRELVFDSSLEANERDHIQKMIESHYWIFGEQYNLVTAAEPKFEEALRRYLYLLRPESKNSVSIDHPDKKKEMDIFICRQRKDVERIENIVLELKSPTVLLGSKELEQVKKYMLVILKQQDFNAPNMFWKFYLVGNRFDTSGYLEQELKSGKQLGDRSLVLKTDQYEIYVKTWSEIFTEFELKHDFLNQRLELERAHLVENYPTADELVKHARDNSAAVPSFP